MLITREMDYAVRVVRALKDGTKVSATEVAKKEHLPQAITYKVLNSLLKSKLIGSMRGVNGGYYLKCDLSQTTLYDICVALGEDMSITECIREGYDCINNRCGECILNKEFNRARLIGNCKKPLWINCYRFILFYYKILHITLCYGLRLK